MRARDFLLEAFSRDMKHGIMILISDHAKDRAAERGVPWAYVDRIIDQLPEIKSKLPQMANFPKFRIRDELTWIDIGCVYNVRASVPTLYVNTVMRVEPGQAYDMPVLSVGVK